MAKNEVATTEESSSLPAYLQDRHMFKGRVHATLNQLKNDSAGTVTGRFSCTEPNLQEVPKPNNTLNQLKNDSAGTVTGRFSCTEPNLQEVPKPNNRAKGKAHD